MPPDQRSDGREGRDEKETGRVEAFSDGVFAVAITLLVLDLRVPKAPELVALHLGLMAALVRQWPTFLAYLTSFATILVMWVNHHRLFTQIRRIDNPFLFLNGLLLLFVTLVPFPTALVAEHIRDPEAAVAVEVYSGTFLLIALSFNVLWRYAAGSGRLLGHEAILAEVQAISSQYRFGSPLYVVCFVLAFVYFPASIALCLAMAVFFAFTSSLDRK